MALDVVQVWLVWSGLPSAAVPELEAVLDEQERDRADRMAPDHRHRFVVAHGVTRMILGRHLGTAPAQLRWVRGPNGKPELAGQGDGLRVNLSHSGELAVLALSGRRPVGVDVQELRPFDARRLSARFFPPAEARYVAAGRGPARQRARFTRLWTRKEACVKGAGERLLPRLALPVGTEPNAEGTVVRDPGGHLPHPLLVRDIPAPPGFRAAVALEGVEPFRVTRRWWRFPG